MTLPTSKSTLYLLIKGCDPAVSQNWNGNKSEPLEVLTHIQDTPTKPSTSRIYRHIVSDAAEFEESMRWNSHIKYLHIKSYVFLSIAPIGNDAFVIFQNLNELSI